MSYSTLPQTAPMEGRFAWCYLGNNRIVDMNDKPLEKPRYECVFYWPKQGADRARDPGWNFFYGLVQDVVQNAFRGQWPMINPRNGEWEEFPIDDCDYPTYVEKYPWARGMWRARLSGGAFRPRIFDLGNNPLVLGVNGRYRPDQFKGDDNAGGDWGMVSVNAYEWAYGQQRRGVSFGIEGIKVTRQDEMIGGAGGRPVEQMFGASTGQSVYGGAPPAAPAPYAPPAAPAPYAPPSAGYAPPAAPAQQGGPASGMPPAPPQIGTR